MISQRSFSPAINAPREKLSKARNSESIDPHPPQTSTGETPSPGSSVLHGLPIPSSNRTQSPTHSSKRTKSPTHSSKRTQSPARIKQPSISTFIPLQAQIEIIKQHHNHIFGHHGIDQTLKLLRLNDHRWDGIKSHVVDFIHSCPHCQKNKSRYAFAIPEYTTTEVYEPFVCASIDTLGPFPPTEYGHKYVFVVVCCFSSFVELIPSFDNTAVAAADALLSIFGRYGATFYLRSDNAANFAGEVMAAFRSLLDISADFTIPYRPSSNGIVERKNGNVLAHLRAMLYANLEVQKNWYKVLPIAQRICNATYVSSLGCSPAEIIFGNSIHLNRGIDKSFLPLLPSLKKTSEYIQDLIDSQTSIIQASQKHLARTKDSEVYKKQSSPPVPFPVGSLVLIAYPTDFRPKLANQMRGPFRVISSVQSVYQVQSFTDPDKIISIHSARLREFYSNLEYHLSPTEVAATDNQEFVIDYIIEHDGETNDLTSLLFKVRWLGYDDTEDTWNSYKSVKSTSALDNYIYDHINEYPDLIRLVPRSDRKLISSVTIKGVLYHNFSFLDGTIRIPEDHIRLLTDRTTLWKEIAVLQAASTTKIMTTRRR